MDPLTALLTRIVGGLITLAVVFAGGWWYGSSGKRELEHQIEASVQKRRADIADLVTTMSARDQKVREELALERSRDHTVYVTLKKEIPVYVTPAADAGCVLTRGFVLHHDAAWRGAALPESPSGPVDAASGIPLSRLSDVDGDNAAACRDLRHEVDAWRAWYPGAAEAWDAFARKTQEQPDRVPQGKGP